MLRHVHYESTMFAPRDSVADTRRDLMWLLEGLTQRNQSYLKARPNTPRLYKSGVRYEVPRQVNGDCEEYEILKKALGRSANERSVRKVLDKVQAVFGGEHFCDIGVILELGSIDCFPLSQKIITRSKSTGQYELLSIGELRFVYHAYEALSYNFKTGRQEFKSIIGFIDKGMKPVSKAHLSNGTDLIATNSHKFWTVSGSAQQDPHPDSYRIGVRTMGEYVSDYNERGRHGRSWRMARSRVVQAARIPELHTTSPTADEAYLAGIYAAEGFQSGSVTGIAQHKLDVRRKIEETLISMGIQYSYDTGRGSTPGSGAQYRLLGGARSEVIARLRDLGVNSFDKRLPQSYLSSDRPTIRRMLDAHADGDGWRPREGVEYKKVNTDSIAAEHSTSSDQLMEQIRLANLILGNPTYAYKQLNHQGAGKDPIWRIDEYNDRALKLRNRESKLRDLGCADLTYATVRNAEPFGEAHVGCVEVEDNHNFFLADGTLTANCDGLACYRAAELRQAGIQARPYMTSRERFGGGTTYHALVLWPPFGNVNYVTSEDPSLLLGMGGPERAADRAEENRKNQERCEVIRKYGVLPQVLADPAAVLGLRQRSRVERELDLLMGRAA